MMKRAQRSPVLAVGIAAAVATLLVACAAPSGWRDTVRESIDTTLQESKTAAKPVPAEVSQALLPPIEIKLPDGKLAPLEPRFDLTVSNAPARDVFLGLIEGTPYSMVVHPDVKGVVSLNLKEVSVPEAVEALRQVYGYEYRREGARFFILGAEMQTRLFMVNYLNLIRQGSSNTSIASGSSLGGAGTSTGGTGTTTTGTTGGTTGGSSTAQVSTQSQSDFWKELTNTLKALVGTESGRKVIVNPQTGLVVVRAMPDELRVVEDYLGVTHATVNRQVVLEAKIIEIELKNEFQSGVNWSLVSVNYNGQVFNSSATLFGGGTPAGGSGSRSSDFGGIFSLLLQTSDFSLLIDALKGQGEVQILSSPRVSTVNNQKAVIKVGGEEFFVTSVTSGGTTTTGGVSTTTTPSVGLSAFFSGISLDVTPQIDENNNIILHIHPSVSVFTERLKSFSVSGESFQLPLALSSIQESDNIVRAQSGQIIIIGGLMKEASTDQDASVPVLADVPLVGSLFKHKRVNRVKRELVILLKPTSISLGKDWNDAVGETHERLKRIRVGS